MTSSCGPKRTGEAVIRHLRHGAPIEPIWVLWHVLLGLGAGLLFIPVDGPPTMLIPLFLVSAMLTFFGLVRELKWVTIAGLLATSLSCIARSALLWTAHVPIDTRLVATFVWSWIALGQVLESYAVYNRGLEGVDSFQVRVPTTLLESTQLPGELIPDDPDRPRPGP